MTKPVYFGPVCGDADPENSPPLPPRRDFSADELCAIMKQARESGVGRLRYGTLEFDFLASSTQSAVAIEPPNAALEAKDLVQNEVDLRQHELEELKFTDPYQYEQLMMENEISAESDAA